MEAMSADSTLNIHDLLSEYVDILSTKGIGEEEAAFRERHAANHNFQELMFTAYGLRAQYEYEAAGGTGIAPKALALCQQRRIERIEDGRCPTHASLTEWFRHFVHRVTG